MTGPAEGTTLSVEVDTVGPDGRPGRVRLTRQFSAAAAPTAEQLAGALREMQERMTALLGPVGAPAPRPERAVQELIETYRPRQGELIELLRADGEITEREAHLLRRHLEGGPSAPATPAEPPAMPGAAPTTPAPRPPGSGAAPVRSVPELIAMYQIHSLRQAGAVRARRQISFEEYMALKRHFSEAAIADPAA